MRYFAITFLMLMMCCYSNSKKGDQKQIGDAHFKRLLESQCLLNHQANNVVGSNTFLFYKGARWDTSFVLILRKDSTLVRGIYNETSPYNTSASYAIGPLFFEGFNFETDSSFWAKVITESKSLLDTINHEWETGSVDGRTYVLSHDFKFTTNNNMLNELEFEKFASFLRQTFIYPVLKKKKEFDEKAMSQ